MVGDQWDSRRTGCNECAIAKLQAVDLAERLLLCAVAIPSAVATNIIIGALNMALLNARSVIVTTQAAPAAA